MPGPASTSGNQIEDVLRIVQVRLGSTMEAALVLRTINERCCKEANDAAYEEIQKYAGFWIPVTLGLQSLVYVGIVSLTDKRKDVASLNRALKLLRGRLPKEKAEELEGILSDVDNRYRDHRNELYAHATLAWHTAIRRFNDAGLTFESETADLESLDYGFKILWSALRDRAIPDREMAAHQHFPHNDALARAKLDAERFIDDCIKARSSARPSA